MQQAKFYEGDYYMLSNFSAHAVLYDDYLYSTSEHAYQCAKFTDEKIREDVKNARSPFAAKKISRQHNKQVRPDWDEVKVETMRAICREKAEQHEEVLEALKKSGDAEIIEDSPFDSFWGCGADGKGRNELGKVWMEIRAELKGKAF